jgi:general secretion pathway protein A
MYNEYFGFKEIPFSIAPDPRYVYMSGQHREALAHLIYGFNSHGGFVLITGEVGTGKTTICRCLLEHIPKNSIIAFIINPKLTVEELLATICDEFGINYPEGTTSIKIFVDLINAFLLDAHGKGLKAVLIIDEAQNLSADVLEQLRLLTNLETNQRKLLQIILLGQPELRDKLSRTELRQLSQRIIARYHLGPLSKEEVGAYIIHRLSIAGVQKELFPSSTVQKLYRLTGGVPRLINLLCDRALLGAFARGKDIVHTSTLTKAAQEVFGENAGQKARRATLIWLLSFFVIVAFGSILAATLYHNESQNIRTVQTVPTIQAVIPPVPETPQLATVQWPDNQPIQKSMDMANHALFEQWGVAYQEKGNFSACQQAKANGLNCQHGLGSLNTLLQLNRPAILKLYDDKDQTYFITLTSLEEETATAVIGTETRIVSVKDIEAQWFGDYTLLWRVPSGYRGDMQIGDRGSPVVWLSEQLALIHEQTIQRDPKHMFDEEVRQQVKKFQLALNLVPDGIAGFHTLIHINTLTGMKIPKLTSKQKDL